MKLTRRQRYWSAPVGVLLVCLVLPAEAQNDTLQRWVDQQRWQRHLGPTLSSYRPSDSLSVNRPAPTWTERWVAVGTAGRFKPERDLLWGLAKQAGMSALRREAPLVVTDAVRTVVFDIRPQSITARMRIDLSVAPDLSRSKAFGALVDSVKAFSVPLSQQLGRVSGGGLLFSPVDDLREYGKAGLGLGLDLKLSRLVEANPRLRDLKGLSLSSFVDPLFQHAQRIGAGGPAWTLDDLERYGKAGFSAVGGLAGRYLTGNEVGSVAGKWLFTHAGNAVGTISYGASHAWRSRELRQQIQSDYTGLVKGWEVRGLPVKSMAELYGAENLRALGFSREITGLPPLRSSSLGAPTFLQSTRIEAVRTIPMLRQFDLGQTRMVTSGILRETITVPSATWLDRMTFRLDPTGRSLFDPMRNMTIRQELFTMTRPVDLRGGAVAMPALGIGWRFSPTGISGTMWSPSAMASFGMGVRPLTTSPFGVGSPFSLTPGPVVSFPPINSNLNTGFGAPSRVGIGTGFPR